MNKKVTRILIVAFLFLNLVSLEEVRGETRQSLLDQSFASPYNYNSNINGLYEYVSQTFTAGINETLKGVSINVIQEYPYLTKLRVSINSVENGLPTMNVLISKNLSSGGSSISEIINFPQGINVTQGVQYAIVVSYINISIGEVQGYWKGDTSNSYPGGECFDWNGSSWISCGNGYDVHFKTYVNTESMYDSIHNINSGKNYDGTIQAAIDEANPGDEIHVDSGTYYGFFDVTKPLILRGNDTGMGKPVVDAEHKPYENSITLIASGITLSGFNTTNANGYNGSGIFVFSENNTIIGNDISKSNFGILVYDHGENKIIGNNASGNGVGFYSLFSPDNTFHDNKAYENDFAIAVYYTYNNSFYTNNFSGNNCSIIFRNANNNLFYNNIFNNTNDLNIDGISFNRWNINKTPAKTVIGGPYLGGNFWAKPNGTGFSQNCTDPDRDGICNDVHQVNVSDFDYLPITYFIPDATIPASISNLTNITYAQTYINWTWDEPVDLDYYKVKIYMDGIFQKDIYKGEQFFNAAGLIPNTEHTISTLTVDTSRNINETWVNHTSSTEPDLVPPIITIASPLNITYLTTNIFLNVSANEVISIWNYSLNGATNVSFTPNTIITAPQGENNISIYAKDIAGNWNSSDVLFMVDSLAPASIIDLHNISYASDRINWTWADPSDLDFSKVMIYLDGTFKTNVTKGSQYYNAQGLNENTFYNISTHTIDTSGNINLSWVNSTARTSDYVPGIITVDDSGGADYTNIQEAINASRKGDSINVAPGTYNENVIVNKTITLIGAGADYTIVNASNPNENALNITVNNVTIHGFTLKDATGSQKAGIYLNRANYSNISNNKVWNNAIGIYLNSSYDNTIFNNYFNNTNNFMISSILFANYWNSSKTQGINIADGPYIGGNFWAYPNGTGFGQTCADINKNGICDSNYTLTLGNVDYLPLAAIPSGYGYISGTVYNSTVIPGAFVITNTSNSTTTDASGLYSLLVSPGTYSLTAAREPLYYTNSPIFVTVITGTTVVKDIELIMKPTGNITGIVRNV